MSLLTSWSSKHTWAVMVKGCLGAHGFHIWGCQKEAPKSWVIWVHLTSPTGKLTGFERIEAEIGSLTNEKHLNGHHPFLSDEWGTIRLISFPTWFCPTKMNFLDKLSFFSQPKKLCHSGIVAPLHFQSFQWLASRREIALFFIQNNNNFYLIKCSLRNPFSLNNLQFFMVLSHCGCGLSHKSRIFTRISHTNMVCCTFSLHSWMISPYFPIASCTMKAGCRAVMAANASRWPLGDTCRRPAAHGDGWNGNLWANGFLVGRLKTYSTNNWHREQKVGNTPAQLATKDGDRNWKNGARTNMEIRPNTCWSSYPPKNGRCSFHCSNLNVGQLVCFLQLGSVGPHSPWMNPRYHGIHIFIDLPVIASPPNFPEQL